MDDSQIIELYFARSEQAIRETDLKYGGQVRRVANGILRSPADAEECASDTWLRAWNAIPPNRPRQLLAWLTRVARNLCLDRLRKAKALKRGEPALLLEELENVAAKLPDAEDGAAIMAAINRFLARQTAGNRVMFLRRYWYMDSISEVAGFTGKSEATVRMALSRMRRSLRAALEKEGIAL
ncbi:MAG: RNA polymerase sigma factor [Clostridia bacterium]|nr:RNA polymerase sigma factor [Clostridia bacterium]